MKGVRKPLVSVLLPVNNGEEYVEESIRSILSQTYDNFEIIVINDGSTDRSSRIVNNIDDPRIRYYEQNNRGLAAALNFGIRVARGEYLARQDQDDFSLPKRLEKQVSFLESHPDYGMVGTWAGIWDGRRKTKKVHKHPEESIVLKFRLLFGNPFVHSSMMIRKEVFEKVGFYSTDESRQPPEDYELWSRVARVFEVANIPEILHCYRDTPTGMSRMGGSLFQEKCIKLGIENVCLVLGRSNSDPVIRNLVFQLVGYFDAFSKPDFFETSRFLNEIAEKLCRLNNLRSGVLNKHVKLRMRAIIRSYISYRCRRLFYHSF